MKLIQLSYFVGVVEYGGYIAAARRLNVAQPALSRQISSLERELGAKLLNRGPGGTVATEAGRRFYRHARSILDQVDTAREEARAGERTIAGAVRLGIPVGMAGALAAKVVTRSERLHPAISVNIEDGLGFQTFEAIETGRVDLGLIANVDRLPNVALEPLLMEDLFFYSRRAGETPDTRDIDLEAVAGVPLVLPDRRVHLRRDLEATVLKCGLSLNVRYEQQSLLTIRNMVRDGVGATVLNWPSMIDIWKLGEVDARRIVNPKMSRIVSLATPSGRPLSPAAAAVCDILRHIVLSEIANGAWRGRAIRATPAEGA